MRALRSETEEQESHQELLTIVLAHRNALEDWSTEMGGLHPALP